MENTAAKETLVNSLKSRSTEELEELLGHVAEAAQSRRIPDGPDHTMTWNEIEHLAEKGVTFGSHTHTHTILTRVSLPEAQRELEVSKGEIQTRLGRPCSIFAYPNGDWSIRLRDVVRSAGYQLAFANSPGIWTQDSDPLSIPRVNIWEGSLVGPWGGFSSVAFEYSTFWKAWRSRKLAAIRATFRQLVPFSSSDRTAAVS
jgi:peptidoglycan/xylan/chitin deacetylase (PgdA/CDA1 family)